MSQERRNFIQSRQKILSQVMEEIPELHFIGASDVLRTKSEKVDFKEGIQIAKKLQDVLLRYRNLTGIGRGFAAPQIGIRKNVVITFLNDEFQVYINPEIVKVSKKTNFYRELCLSSGMTWGDVKRPEAVTIEFTNRRGERITESHDGLIARLLQHECDHPKGIINLDIAEPGSIELVSSDPLGEKLRAGRY